MSTGTLGKTGDSAFSTQVLGRFYGISRLAKTSGRCYYTDTKRWYQCTGKRKAPKIIRAKTDPEKILLKIQVLQKSHCETIGADPTESEVTKMLDTKTEQKWPLTIVDGIAKGHFFWAGTKKERSPRKRPKPLSLYHSRLFLSIICRENVLDSPFSTIYPEVFCSKSRIARKIKMW